MKRQEVETSKHQLRPAFLPGHWRDRSDHHKDSGAPAHLGIL